MSDEAVEQGDEADEAGASDGASQLIPGVRRTFWSATTGQRVLKRLSSFRSFDFVIESDRRHRLLVGRSGLAWAHGPGES